MRDVGKCFVALVLLVMLVGMLVVFAAGVLSLKLKKETHNYTYIAAQRYVSTIYIDVWKAVLLILSFNPQTTFRIQ